MKKEKLPKRPNSASMGTIKCDNCAGNGQIQRAVYGLNLPLTCPTCNGIGTVRYPTFNRI